MQGRPSAAHATHVPTAVAITNGTAAVVVVVIHAVVTVVIVIAVVVVIAVITIVTTVVVIDRTVGVIANRSITIFQKVIEQGVPATVARGQHGTSAVTQQQVTETATCRRADTSAAEGAATGREEVTPPRVREPF